MAAGVRESPHQNHLLDALPSADYERLTAHAELIVMALGDVLYEPGTTSSVRRLSTAVSSEIKESMGR